ncbi:hypothetical protein Skr01_29710 [Sphaerisporangium krabiense]|uniref:Uncharacterized protein n=1 Tax=Sphaerisporangium krabiense TaxID=763782 RepID=A0A7W9DNW7_9ACTN|nr:hypothetical protein [Sphaerisporangium krabiense]MBB5625778.1 hypothetical protein [Sphaerisporangium krabiense]GII62886.1 hypothetical protein Skr01_29710 [Sphaerisporangium krabiense]
METFRKRTAFGALARAATVTATVAAALTVGAVTADAATIPKFKPPKVFGTTFQPDPRHDFTKHISPRHDGILRGWVTHYSGGVAEYEPIKWVKDKSGNTQGWFTGPPEGDNRAYASPVSSKVAFYSALGCRDQSELTVNRQGLGNKRCSRSVLISRMKAYPRPALITVHQGKIVKFQEIYTP